MIKSSSSVEGLPTPLNWAQYISRSFTMKTILLLLATTLVYEEAECSPENMLADKTMAKMSAWIQTEGPNWATLSGQFDEGIVQGQTNDNYTLALAGPAFNLDGSLSRISEAILIDGDPDPNYESSQKLIFSVAIKNVTVDYRHVAYNDDNNGFFNITSMGTSDGISAQVTIDLKGSGDSCFGFADLVTINFSGNLYVSTAGLQEAFPQVIAAVSNHFRTNVPNAVGLLLEAAVFNSLDGFDICTGVYNPLPQANVMARRIINAMQDGLNQNIQYWAELPGFYKTDSDVNGTTMDQVVVRAGNFSSIGTLTRNGDASYSGNGDPKWTYLNVVIETDTMTVMYGNVLYTSNLEQYEIAVKVDALKMITSMSFSFYQGDGASNPSCVDGSMGAAAFYQGGNVIVTSLTAGIPTDVLLKVNDVITEGFMNNIGGGAEDLFISAGQYALKQVLGEATYWYSSNNATTSFLNFTIETDKFIGIYPDILFTTLGRKQYNLGEQVEAGRIRTSYSVEFTVPSGSHIPSCSAGSQQVSSQYVTEDDIYLVYIGEDVPSWPDDQQVLYKLVTKGFLENINGAAEDLFTNVGAQALAKVCQ
ncbi:hypothetical protein GE061_010822 [Apolygus lucorum]|uniref:Uncharacterized protein n=1 Tax=Apolygus lucorum TaxID=248454 RepID=A0A8S9XW14_APOLU|nr:hypothetical protein GE061_010822 [Apolygus lucorum]